MTDDATRERVAQIEKRIQEGDSVILQSRLMPLRDIDITDYVEDQQERLAEYAQKMEVVTPPEVWQAQELLRLRAVLGELALILAAWDPGDVCLREWDPAPCPCAACRARRVVRYGL